MSLGDHRTGAKTTRRAFVGSLLATAMGSVRAARAQQVSVPVSLQIQLLSRVVAYDRSFASRAGGAAVILVFARAGNAGSTRTAAQIGDALRRLPNLGGLPIAVEIVAFSGAAALAQQVATQHACIVYLSTGLSNDVAAIAGALDGRSVMTVSASEQDAGAGAVLAFELDEARPRLVVNLAHARRQLVAFSSNLLRLARVVAS